MSNKDHANDNANDCEERICSLCTYAEEITGREELLCTKRGVVPSGYFCRKFKYDPLKRVPRRKPPIELPELPRV